MRPSKYRPIHQHSIGPQPNKTTSHLRHPFPREEAQPNNQSLLCKPPRTASLRLAVAGVSLCLRCAQRHPIPSPVPPKSLPDLGPQIPSGARTRPRLPSSETAVCRCLPAWSQVYISCAALLRWYVRGVRKNRRRRRRRPAKPTRGRTICVRRRFDCCYAASPSLSSFPLARPLWLACSSPLFGFSPVKDARWQLRSVTLAHGGEGRGFASSCLL